MLLRALYFFGNKEDMADTAREVILAPAFAKREDISKNRDVLPL
jgi:hypothetical protein